MFLSIIIPVYNAEKYIRECLDSCINQDIDCCDYEIICINDGSTDSSLDILHSYAKKHKNIIVIDKENSGVSETRNIGVSVAKGDYMWFVDSDDFIKSNCLNYLKNVAASKYDIISFYAFLFGETFSLEEYALTKYDLKNDKRFYHAANFSSLYKSDLIINNDIRYKSEIAYGEDTFFSHEIYSIAESKKSIDDILYFYRKNPESVMNSLQYLNRRVRYANSTIKVIELLNNGLKSGRFNKQSSESFLKSKYKQFLMMLVRLDIKNAIVCYKSMIQKGLLDKEIISEYNLPRKNRIIFVYITKHFKIWFRSILKKILPQKIVKLIHKKMIFLL